MRIKWIFTLVVCTILAAAGIQAADFIGAAKCKMCHKVQYTSWLEMPHAKAFDRLSDEEKGNAECLKCHATGGSADFPGVQCESCHGPGSDYKSMKVMKDLQASLDAGLIQPDEASCLGCHSNAPHDVKPFNFEERKADGIHEHKKKAE